MEFAAVQEAYENATKPLKVRRTAWPAGDYAEYNHDGIQRRCANGKLFELDEEDFEADDWQIEVGIPSIGTINIDEKKKGE